MSNSKTATFVQVFQGMNPTEPYLLRDWLLANGVDAVVRGFDLMSALGEVPATIGGYPSVWVSPESAARTQPLIQQFFEPQSVKKPWTCTGCDENNPGEFGSCWNCGQDHPSIR